ncbi:hypothetical protein [Streptomyces sp. 150FB]|nr:hypothetical protein [Streptomyces sp. 150FB]
MTVDGPAPPLTTRQFERAEASPSEDGTAALGPYDIRAASRDHRDINP